MALRSPQDVGDRPPSVSTATGTVSCEDPDPCDDPGSAAIAVRFV